MSAPASPEPPLLPGLAALADRFDGFLLDQWGVLHDGTNAYPHAHDCLIRLRDAGKRVVILSNSGRLSAYNAALMERIGFARDLFETVVSAGEDCRRALLTEHRALGRRCYGIVRPQDAELLDGTGLVMVDDPAAAELILVVGTDLTHGLAEAYAPVLEAGLARGLPMICANPDFVRITATGPSEAPGAIARAYQRRGGRVHWHGKPHPGIYRGCLERLAPIPPGRILAVGDSLEHDIAGARGVGLASALVAGGIHAAELGTPPDPARLASLLAKAAVRPDFVVPIARW